MERRRTITSKYHEILQSSRSIGSDLGKGAMEIELQEMKDGRRR